MNSLDEFRKPPNGKTMGIEIECFVEAEQAPNRYTYQGFFYITTDGSIQCHDTGLEFVSMPLPPTWLKKEIGKLFKKNPALKSNDSCGVHIHVSRKWLSERKGRLIQEFINNEMSIGDFEGAFGRRPNDYCQRNTFGITRYNCVNNENSKTIEFRMFKSGDAAWCRYCVDMAVYLVENAHHLNFAAFSAFVDSHKPTEETNDRPLQTAMDQPVSFSTLFRRII
jgi:hypothetical protein